MWKSCPDHIIHHPRSWNMSMPNWPPYNKPYGPDLVCQKLHAGQVWNRILVTRNTVIYLLSYWMGIQQPDHLIQTLMIRFVIDCIQNSMQFWAAIIWIKALVAIDFLLNLSCTLLCLSFVLNDLCQLFQSEWGWRARTLAFLKFITLLYISHTSIWIQ